MRPLRMKIATVSQVKRGSVSLLAPRLRAGDAAARGDCGNRRDNPLWLSSPPHPHPAAARTSRRGRSGTPRPRRPNGQSPGCRPTPSKRAVHEPPLRNHETAHGLTGNIRLPPRAPVPDSGLRRNDGERPTPASLRSDREQHRDGNEDFPSAARRVCLFVIPAKAGIQGFDSLPFQNGRFADCGAAPGRGHPCGIIKPVSPRNAGRDAYMRPLRKIKIAAARRGIPGRHSGEGRNPGF